MRMVSTVAFSAVSWLWALPSPSPSSSPSSLRAALLGLRPLRGAAARLVRGRLALVAGAVLRRLGVVRRTGGRVHALPPRRKQPRDLLRVARECRVRGLDRVAGPADA